MTAVNSQVLADSERPIQPAHQSPLPLTRFSARSAHRRTHGTECFAKLPGLPTQPRNNRSHVAPSATV